MQQNIIDSGQMTLHPPKKSEDYEVIPLDTEQSTDTHKPGPKPKRLVAVEVQGFEVGRGLRKKVVIPEDVYKLAALGCTDKEIALWFDIAYDTLRYNFADIIEKGRQDLKTALRKAMLNNALNGNAALQIFLAKNMLGMSDNPTNTDDRKPLPWSDD
jgi:hypothetical protein